jgi:hypothetical protein
LKKREKRIVFFSKPPRKSFGNEPKKKFQLKKISVHFDPISGTAKRLKLAKPHKKVKRGSLEKKPKLQALREQGDQTSLRKKSPKM